jgi:nicotinamidase-related amidase
MNHQRIRSGAIDVRDVGTSSTVLLMVDVINPLDFDGAQQLHAPAVAAARSIAKLKTALTRDGMQTVYANDNYGIWRSDFVSLCKRCSALRGAPGVLARTLKPRRQDFTILKPRHSAFYSTPLDLLLKQLKCKRLVITGIAADNCVLFTAMDAYLRGHSLWIPSDCVAAESEEARTQALSQMSRVLKASTKPAWE